MHDARTRLGGLLAIAIVGSALAAACGDSETPGGLGGQGGASGGAVGTGGAGASGGAVIGSGGDATAGASSSGGAPFSGVAGEGLQLTILDVEVSSAGVAKVEFTVTDDAGRPLDREGKLTFGAVSPSFILSWLGVVPSGEGLPDEGESTQYTAYTLRKKTPTDTNIEPVMQSSTDTGGTYETLAVGHYRYTLGTKIDITSERESLTHTLGVYATRTLGDVRYVATEIKSWVPDGSEVETVLDVVTTDACNQCHTRLEAHGGARRGVEMCQLCHTESNSINPETGNTFDFQVMIHKIHRGQALPSVVAGDPYYFVGYMDSVDDFSHVAYPWQMPDCGKCHQGSQGDRWNTRPAFKPCTSCHDRTYFGPGDAPEGWEKHTGGVHDDSECVVCHSAESQYPIQASHTTSITDEDRPVVEATIFGVENTSPGDTPEIEFEITIDGVPQDILTNRPNRLRFKIWGPTSDVNLSLQETVQDTGASLNVPECGGTPTPPCVEAVGEGFVLHTTLAIPDAATGSYIAGFDGRYNDPTYGNIAFVNPTFTFAVTGNVVERRAIVDRDTCNRCHGDLGEHGGGYKDPLYCLNCHNTTGTFELEVPPAPGETLLLTSLNLKDFLHSKHSQVLYPSPLNACEQCHLEGTYTLPLASGLLSSTATVVTCPAGVDTCEAGMGGATGMPTETPLVLGPTSAACVSCHSSPDTIAHVQTNTAPSGGEACATCHGSGKTYDVELVHALDP
jgi:OmcA/MtrC family decaheme c-type cytochrome